MQSSVLVHVRRNILRRFHNLCASIGTFLLLFALHNYFKLVFNF
jgi:hypothetical protein